LIPHTLGAGILEPLLEGSMLEIAINTILVPTTAVMVTRVQEDAVLRLVQQVGSNQFSQTATPLIDSSNSVVAKIVGNLPAVVGWLNGEDWSLDKWRSMLGKDAFPVFARGGKVGHAAFVDTRGAVHEFIDPTHAGVITGRAFVVEEESTVGQTNNPGGRREDRFQHAVLVLTSNQDGEKWPIHQQSSR